jgi:hypothetical protein
MRPVGLLHHVYKLVKSRIIWHAFRFRFRSLNGILLKPTEKESCSLKCSSRAHWSATRWTFVIDMHILKLLEAESMGTMTIWKRRGLGSQSVGCLLGHLLEYMVSNIECTTSHGAVTKLGGGAGWTRVMQVYSCRKRASTNFAVSKTTSSLPACSSCCGNVLPHPNDRSSFIRFPDLSLNPPCIRTVAGCIRPVLASSGASDVTCNPTAAAVKAAATRFDAGRPCRPRSRWQTSTNPWRRIVD